MHKVRDRNSLVSVVIDGYQNLRVDSFLVRTTRNWCELKVHVDIFRCDLLWLIMRNLGGLVKVVRVDFHDDVLGWNRIIVVVLVVVASRVLNVLLMESGQERTYDQVVSNNTVLRKNDVFALIKLRN